MAPNPNKKQTILSEALAKAAETYFYKNKLNRPTSPIIIDASIVDWPDLLGAEPKKPEEKEEDDDDFPPPPNIPLPPLPKTPKPPLPHKNVAPKPCVLRDSFTEFCRSYIVPSVTNRMTTSQIIELFKTWCIGKAPVGFNYPSSQGGFSTWYQVLTELNYTFMRPAKNTAGYWAVVQGAPVVPPVVPPAVPPAVPPVQQANTSEVKQPIPPPVQLERKLPEFGGMTLEEKILYFRNQKNVARAKLGNWQTELAKPNLDLSRKKKCEAKIKSIMARFFLIEKQELRVRSESEYPTSPIGLSDKELTKTLSSLKWQKGHHCRSHPDEDEEMAECRKILIKKLDHSIKMLTQ